MEIYSQDLVPDQLLDLLDKFGEPSGAGLKVFTSPAYFEHQPLVAQLIHKLIRQLQCSKNNKSLEDQDVILLLEEALGLKDKGGSIYQRVEIICNEINELKIKSKAAVHQSVSADSSSSLRLSQSDEIVIRQLRQKIALLSTEIEQKHRIIDRHSNQKTTMTESFSAKITSLEVQLKSRDSSIQGMKRDIHQLSTQLSNMQFQFQNQIRTLVAYKAESEVNLKLRLQQISQLEESLKTLRGEHSREINHFELKLQQTLSQAKIKYNQKLKIIQQLSEQRDQLEGKVLKLELQTKRIEGKMSIQQQNEGPESESWQQKYCLLQLQLSQCQAKLLSEKLNLKEAGLECQLKIQQFQNTLRQKNQRIANLVNQNELFESQIKQRATELQKEAARYYTRETELLSSISALQARLKSRQQEYSNLKDDAEAIKAKLQLQKNQFQQAKIHFNSLEQKYREQYESQQHKFRLLQERLAQSQKRETQKQGANNQGEVEKDQVSQLIAKSIESYKNQLSAANKKLADYQEEVSDLRKGNIKSSQIIPTDPQQDAHRQRLMTLQRQLAQAKEQSKLYKMRMDSMVVTIPLAQECYIKQQKNIGQKQFYTDRQNTLNKQIEQLRRQKSIILQQLSNYKQQIKISNQQKQKRLQESYIQENLRQHQSIGQNIPKQLQKLTIQIQQLKRKNSNLQQQLSTQKQKQRASIQKQISSRQKPVIESLQHVKQDQSEQLQQLKQQNQDLHRQKLNLQNKVQVLKQKSIQLEKLKNQNKILQQVKTSLEKQILAQQQQKISIQMSDVLKKVQSMKLENTSIQKIKKQKEHAKFSDQQTQVQKQFIGQPPQLNRIRIPQVEKAITRQLETQLSAKQQDKLRKQIVEKQQLIKVKSINFNIPQQAQKQIKHVNLLSEQQDKNQQTKLTVQPQSKQIQQLRNKILTLQRQKEAIRQQLLAEQTQAKNNNQKQLEQMQQKIIQLAQFCQSLEQKLRQAKSQLQKRPALPNDNLFNQFVKQQQFNQELNSKLSQYMQKCLQLSSQLNEQKKVQGSQLPQARHYLPPQSSQKISEKGILQVIQLNNQLADRLEQTKAQLRQSRAELGNLRVQLQNSERKYCALFNCYCTVRSNLNV